MSCPPWDYKLHPNRFTHIAVVQKQLIDAIHGGVDQLANCCDPRDVHKRLFRALAPDGHPYYAGNYRGSKKYPCLTNATSTIGGHKTSNPRSVGFEMTHYSNKLRVAVRELDARVTPGAGSKEAAQSRAQTVLDAARLAANFFVRLQGIHPFWDGNGHIGRFLVMAILGRYGILMAPGWNIDNRPPYDTLITEYQAGQTRRLEAFILASIIDPKAAP